MSQHQILLKHFEAGHSLTVLEALQRFRVYALSQRVGEINKTLASKGIKIASEKYRTLDGKRIARYFLKKNTAPKDGDLLKDQNV